MEQRVRALEGLLAANGVTNTDPIGRQHSSSIEIQNDPTDPNPASSTAASLPVLPSIPDISGSAFDMTLNLSCSLGAFPASSITNQSPNDRGDTIKSKADLISRGCISEATAEQLFEYYQQHLDKHIYSLLKRDCKLSEIRARSSLLTASVCAVAAFTSASNDYESCLKAFREEVTEELFAKDHTFDEIRALCIGSFWLNDISVALCGLGEAATICVVN